MAVQHCTNPHAGNAECGYDPNSYGGEEKYAVHAELAHEITYVGMVLCTGEHNYYDDSDFYAMVWDEPTQSVKKVATGTTRGWSYHDGAKVDASSEVRAKAEAYEAGRLLKIFTEDVQGEKLAALKELTQGVEVKSLTTRGKNKGVVGYVQTTMKSNYGPGYVAGIQVKGEDKLRWIDTERVERTDFPVSEKALKAALELTPEERGYVSRKARARAVSNLSN